MINGKKNLKYYTCIVYHATSRKPCCNFSIQHSRSGLGSFRILSSPSVTSFFLYFRMSRVAFFLIIAVVLFLLMTDKSELMKNLLFKSTKFVFGEQASVTHSFIEMLNYYPQLVYGTMSTIASAVFTYVPVSIAIV